MSCPAISQTESTKPSKSVFLSPDTNRKSVHLGPQYSFSPVVRNRFGAPPLPRKRLSQRFCTLPLPPRIDNDKSLKTTLSCNSLGKNKFRRYSNRNLLTDLYSDDPYGPDVVTVRSKLEVYIETTESKPETRASVNRYVNNSPDDLTLYNLVNSSDRRHTVILRPVRHRG